jgi:hypothetical protein
MIGAGPAEIREMVSSYFPTAKTEYATFRVPWPVSIPGDQDF